MLLFSARKNTPSTQKPITNVRRAIILAVPPSLSGKNHLLFPSISCPLIAGYGENPTQQHLHLFCISAFSFPRPKLPSAVLHLKMPFSLRFSCVCAFLLCQRRSAYSSYSTPLPCSYYNEIFIFLSRQRPYFKSKNQNKIEYLHRLIFFQWRYFFYLSFFYCFVLLLNACDQCFHCIFQNFISECFR